MELNVDTLKQLGGFVSGPVKKEITWVGRGENGEDVEHIVTTYVRRVSCAAAEAIGRAYNEGRDIYATRISTLICTEDGSQVFTYEEAQQLLNINTMELIRVISEVNAEAPKKSPQPTSSSAS